MSTINSDEIISILKEEIQNYDEISKDKEVGTVVSVGDGIANIYGIDHAAYGEIVTFENGLKGMVQDIRQNSIGCILFGDDREIKEGTIYPLLIRLEKKGIIKGEFKASPLGPDRKYYKLTEEGVRYMESFQESWSAIREAMDRLWQKGGNV